MQNHRKDYCRRIVLIFLTILLFNKCVIATDLNSGIKGSDNDHIDSTELVNIFIEKYSFNKLFIVFAGPYPSSPTSSFGHIFALMEPKDYKPLLLWDAIDFSADISEYGSFNFFFNGLFGSLDGEYKILPFYDKLREYTFIESRSLWLFPIDMDSEESKKFLKNLFIVKGKVLPYRFSNRNCASEIYRLIDISRNKSNEINNLLVLPYNVIDNIVSDSAIYIESINSSLKYYNSNKMSRDTNISPHDMTDSQKKKNRLSLLEWKYFHEDKILTDSEQHELRQLRKEILDSENDDFQSLHKYSKKFSMHPTMQAGAGYQYNTENRSELIIGYRFGLHDFFDEFNVYPKHDYLTLLDMEIGITSSKLFLNKLMIFDQTSLQPVSFLSMSSSWNIGFGIDQRKELGNRQLATGLFLGYGYTIPLLSDNLSLSFLLNANPVFLSNQDFSLLCGSDVIFRWYIFDNVKFKSVFQFTTKDISNIKYYYSIENNIGINITDYFVLIISNSFSKFNHDFSIKLNYIF